MRSAEAAATEVATQLDHELTWRSREIAMLPAVLLVPIYGSLGGLFGGTKARSGVSIELQTSGADPGIARLCAKATLPPHCCACTTP